VNVGLVKWFEWCLAFHLVAAFQFPFPLFGNLFTFPFPLIFLRALALLVCREYFPYALIYFIYPFYPFTLICFHYKWLLLVHLASHPSFVLSSVLICFHFLSWVRKLCSNGAACGWCQGLYSFYKFYHSFILFSFSWDFVCSNRLVL
jgi:hypothetical protein